MEPAQRRMWQRLVHFWAPTHRQMWAVSTVALGHHPWQLHLRVSVCSANWPHRRRRALLQELLLHRRLLTDYCRLWLPTFRAWLRRRKLLLQVTWLHLLRRLQLPTAAAIHRVCPVWRYRPSLGLWMCCSHHLRNLKEEGAVRLRGHGGGGQVDTPRVRFLVPFQICHRRQAMHGFFPFVLITPVGELKTWPTWLSVLSRLMASAAAIAKVITIVAWTRCNSQDGFCAILCHCWPAAPTCCLHSGCKPAVRQVHYILPVFCRYKLIGKYSLHFTFLSGLSSAKFTKYPARKYSFTRDTINNVCKNNFSFNYVVDIAKWYQYFR